MTTYRAYFTPTAILRPAGSTPTPPSRRSRWRGSSTTTIRWI